MPVEIVVPRSGWSMEEGTFAGWLKQPGETVNPGDRLFALESDKSVEEAESMDAGVLWIPPGAPRTGDRVKVGQLLGYLLAAGEAPPAGAAAAPPPEKAPADGPAPSRAPSELGADIGGDVPPPRAAAAPAPASVGPAPAAPVTPRARRTARALSVDVAGVVGTGRGGRVRERDVLAKGAQPVSGRAPAPAPRPDSAPREAAPVAAGSSVPITTMRRTIAERMVRSLAATAPVTLTTRVDATQLVVMRAQLKAMAQATEAVVPSYTEIIVKIVAKALHRHPLLAGRWETDRIVLPSSMDIGIAVDTADGLMVPVVRGVERLALPELSRRARELVEATRARRVRADDLQGGVFTVTSLGSYGIDAFTPIINYPQTAILGVGAIRREAGPTPEGTLGLREVMTLSLTFDHRIVDGAPAAAFLQTVCAGLLSPFAWALTDFPMSQ